MGICKVRCETGMSDLCIVVTYATSHPESRQRWNIKLTNGGQQQPDPDQWVIIHRDKIRRPAISRPYRRFTKQRSARLRQFGGVPLRRDDGRDGSGFALPMDYIDWLGTMTFEVK